MIGRAPESNQLGTSTPKLRRAHYAILGAVCALVIGVYAWSAQSVFVESRGLYEDESYYNLLVEGFRAGQLQLKSDVTSHPWPC